MKCERKYNLGEESVRTRYLIYEPGVCALEQNGARNLGKSTQSGKIPFECGDFVENALMRSADVMHTLTHGQNNEKSMLCFSE